MISTSRVSLLHRIPPPPPCEYITRSCYFRLSTFCVCLTCWFTTTPSRHEPTHASKHPNNCRTAKWIHFSSSFKIRIQQRLKGVGIKLKNDVCFFSSPEIAYSGPVSTSRRGISTQKERNEPQTSPKMTCSTKVFVFFYSNQILFFFVNNY